jgi:hypothetical protein
MILDYEFARLYKILEGSITRTLTTRSNDGQAKPPDQSAIVLAQYTDVIQQQYQQINVYQQQEKQFNEERDLYQKKIVELEQSLHDLHGQYNSLKVSSEQGKWRRKRVLYLWFVLGQNPDDSLRTLCEQQQMELEYLRNMMV